MTRTISMMLITGFLFSCATKPPQMRQDTPRALEIQDIRITEGNGKTIVELEGESEMIYTTFQLTDPNRLIIDIAEISLGDFDEEIYLEEGPIRSIRPASGGGNNIVRLELLLDESVDAIVSSDGPNLIIDADEAGRMKNKFVFFDGGVSPPPESEETDSDEPGETPPVVVQPIEEGISETEIPPASTALVEESNDLSGEEVGSLDLLNPAVEVSQITPMEDEGLGETSAPTETAFEDTIDFSALDTTEAEPPLLKLPSEEITETATEPPLFDTLPDFAAADEEMDLEAALKSASEPLSDKALEAAPEPVDPPHENQQALKPMEETEVVAIVTESPAETLLTDLPVIEKETSEETQPIDEKPLPAAKWVNAIQFIKGKDLTLLITSDGILNPRFFNVDKKRIAIDFPGVKTSLKRTKVLARDPLVSQLRIGKHARKLRLVVDLASDVSYTWQQKQKDLEITFRTPVPALESETAVDSLPSDEVIATLPPPLIVDKGEKISDPIVKRTATQIPEKSETTVPVSAGSNEEVGLPKAADLARVADTKQVHRKKNKTFLRKRSKEKAEKGKNLFARKKATVEVAVEPQKPKYSGKKISLDFQDAEITNVIRLIADVSHLNFVMGEDVKGKVSLKLSNVPWDQALDIILEMNSLGKVQQGNIIRITTLANLSTQRDAEIRAKETKVNSADLFTRIIYVNYGKAGETKKLLQKLLSPRGEIMIDNRTNAIIIKDIQENLSQIEGMAKKLDTKTPQVLIEARIAEVKPTFKKSLGVQWGADFKTTKGGSILGVGNASSGSAFNGPTPDFAVNLPASNNLGGIGFTFGRFTQSPFTLDLRLSAGEVQEMTRIVSTPKIMVLDNHEAIIEQGESVPFATTSDKGTQVQFIDANLTLKVTPHISPDGGISLDVHLTKNEAGIPPPGSPGPPIFKKEITTHVLLMDGETMVIGGIYETQKSKSESGIPFLKDIPGLGWLFKNKEEREETTELLVFLTPTVME